MPPWGLPTSPFQVWLSVHQTSSNAQTSGPPVNLAVGKHQARVSLSLELVSCAYPTSYPEFEPGPSAWETWELPLHYPVPLGWTKLLGLVFVQLPSSMSVNSARHLRRETRFLPVNSGWMPPTKSGFLNGFGLLPYLFFISFVFYTCISITRE